MASRRKKAFRFHREARILVAEATRAIDSDDLAEVSLRILREWEREPASSVLIDLRQAHITPCPVRPPASDPLMFPDLPMRMVYLVPPSMMDWLKPRRQSLTKRGLSRVVIDDLNVAYAVAVGWDRMVANDRAESVLHQLASLPRVFHPLGAQLASEPRPLHAELESES